MTFDLDHVGIAVRDLDRAALAYRRLGFTLTEKSFHRASRPEGPAELSGTGNHCVILRRGYIELIAVTSADYTGGLSKLLERHEGLHLIAAGTASAEKAAATLAETTGALIPPRLISRPFTDRKQAFTARFAIADLPEGWLPEAQVFAIEHLTREAIWQPHLMDHPNGALGLAGVVVCVAEPRPFAARVAKLFAAPLHGTMVKLASGSIEAVDQAGLVARFAGVTPLAIPYVAAVTITVDDVARAQAVLAAGSMPFGRDNGRLWVPPEAAHGAILEYVVGDR